MKLRPLGQVTLDLEVILEEMVDSHELQMGEILAIVKAWVEIHRPDALEIYEDGSNPFYFYGPGD